MLNIALSQSTQKIKISSENSGSQYYLFKILQNNSN